MAPAPVVPAVAMTRKGARLWARSCSRAARRASGRMRRAESTSISRRASAPRPEALAGFQEGVVVFGGYVEDRLPVEGAETCAGGAVASDGRAR